MYTPVIPELKQEGGMTKTLSRTISEKHIHMLICFPMWIYPQDSISTKSFNHRLIQQCFSGTSYMLLTILSLGLKKWTAAMASSFMKLVVSWRLTFLQPTCIRCGWCVRQYGLGDWKTLSLPKQKCESFLVYLGGISGIFQIINSFQKDKKNNLWIKFL